jgi:hypothetical protein
MKPGPTRMDIGLKRQATSSLDPGTRIQIIQGVRHNVARQFVAANDKQQATSSRIPDSSNKRQAPSNDKNF